MTMSKQVLRLLFCVVTAISGLIGCAGGGGSRSSGDGTPVPQPVNAAPTIQFSAQPASIFLRQNSTLSWHTTSATKVNISSLGDFPAVGSTTVSPTTTQTYTATATGPNGSATTSVTVTVAATASPIQHVIVLILQNNSFDHLFGVFPAPSGQTIEGIRPGIPGFTQVDAAGKSVSPFLLTDTSPSALPERHADYVADLNSGAMDKFAATEGDISMGYYDNTTPGIATLWGLAQQFALADHYFQSVLVEAPTNQLYMVAASDNNRAFSVQPAFGPCNPTDSQSKPYTFKHVGDQLNAANIQWTFFQERYGDCGAFVPAHDPFQYFTDTQNGPHIQDYSQFTLQLNNGTLPAVTFISPARGHDMHPGDGSIQGGINLTAKLVQAVQNSTIWQNTAILITWDTGGGWYDHVAPQPLDSQGLGFRVPLLVISPLAKPGYVSHTVMDHVSILRFIQWNWGLNSLNARNQLSGELRDMFSF